MDLDQLDDALLADRAADGDVRSFAALVRRHGPAVRAYAAHILGTQCDADDVMQDTFITAWAQLRQLEDSGRVKGWLLRIASRKALDRLRSRRPSAEVDDAAAAPAAEGPAHVVEARAAHDALSIALAELPALQRQCWLLKETGGYSYDEIAEALDLSNSTVRGMLARARGTLVTRLEAWR